LEVLSERVRLSHVIGRPHGRRLARHAVEDHAVDRAVPVAHDFRAAHRGEAFGTLRGDPIYEGAVVSVQRNLPFGHTSPPALVSAAGSLRRLAGGMKTLRPERIREGVGKECPGTPYWRRVAAPEGIVSRSPICVNREIAIAATP